MRSLGPALVLFIAACGGGDPNSHDFGPYDLAPFEEQTDTCVQITLHNQEPIYVNAVELTTGPGFHHSNWFWVPESTFFGPDGSFPCGDRNYNEATAAVFGGVLFAQSTQAPHEIQQFPGGAVVTIPPRSKIFSQIHLLNPNETPLHIEPNITITPIADRDVTTRLNGMSFENHALALPPEMQSKFTLECDLAAIQSTDFRLYYALAHYHALGIQLDIDAIKADGTSTSVFTTTSKIGDVLGGPIDPLFEMGAYQKLRFSCTFYNPSSNVVRWGTGDQEMCVFLAFTDSKFEWGGGVIDDTDPLNPVMVGNEMQYTNPCLVIATDTL